MTTPNPSRSVSPEPTKELAKARMWLNTVIRCDEPSDGRNHELRLADAVRAYERAIQDDAAAAYIPLVEAARAPHELHICASRDCEAYATWVEAGYEDSTWRCEEHAHEKPDWWTDAEDREWVTPFEPDDEAIALVTALAALVQVPGQQQADTEQGGV